MAFILDHDVDSNRDVEFCEIVQSMCGESSTYDQEDENNSYHLRADFGRGRGLQTQE